MIQGLAELLVLLCELELLELPKAHGLDDLGSHQLDFLARRSGKVGEALHLRRQGHGGGGWFRDYWTSLLAPSKLRWLSSPVLYSRAAWG